MRSSVSVILSDPPVETPMSYPDYTSHPSHHQGLLVLVRQVGNLPKSCPFSSLLSRICGVTQVAVNDSSGNARSLYVHYKTNYPVENNDWGDFQAHRKLLGIISIGHVKSQSDLNDVCRQHESLKVKYCSTVVDSRCIILGVNPDGTVYEKEPIHTPSTCGTPELSSSGSTLSHREITTNDNHPDSLISSPELSSSDKPEKLSTVTATDRDSGVYISPPSGPDTKHHNGFFSHGGSRSSDSGSENTSELGSAVDDIERNNNIGSNCNGDLLNIICHDRVSRSSSSTDSSSIKPIAKVFLQPPLCFKTRALFYPTEEHAVNIESQIQEFISSLFWVLEYKRMDKSQEKHDKPQLLCAPFERKDIVGLDMDSRNNRKKCLGRYKKHLADLSLQVGLPNEALAQYTQTVEILKGCNDWLWLAACYEGLCAASLIISCPQLMRSNSLPRKSSLGPSEVSEDSKFPKSHPKAISSNSLPPGLDSSFSKQQSKFCLSSFDIVEKYKETIIHYSKYRNAGVIETEASIKAVHVLIQQRHHLLASEFLSNVVFINLQLSEDEKIVRFNALSDLYKQIGFYRKASFFRRVAAMRCVAPQNQEPQWNRCYRLLLLSLEGYKLNLDIKKFIEDGRPGWPVLQKQILQELIGTSQRMQEHALCTRHQAFLLSSMLPFFSAQEKRECFNMLEVVSEKRGEKKCSNTSLPVRDSTLLIPPVHFTNIPMCKYVNVMSPSAEKQVELRNKSLPVVDQSPFIFSPFQSIANINNAPGKIDYQWVEGDVCEVSFEFVNPMGFQLKLSSVMLITEGIEFEPWTSTVVLEPSTEEIQAVSLRGRPQEPGELHILGYSFSLGGVLSYCLFSSLDHLKIPFYSLDVVPALPCVQVFCDASSSDTGLVSDGGLDEKSRVFLSMNAGETRECSIMIHNVSSQHVELVDVSLDSHLSSEISSEIFQYSLENLQSQLPIPPGGRASLTLYVYAYSEFSMPGYSLEDEVAPSVTSGSDPPSMVFGAPPLSVTSVSRHSNMTSSLRGQKAHRAKSSASLSSSKSGSSARSESSLSALASSSLNISVALPAQGLPNRLLEGSLKISYTGGRGKEAMYWRTCDVKIAVEVSPSLLLTRWDVLPAESPSQCYVVLDLLNYSGQEMDLCYTANKRILIQAAESCRVPIPIDRCPLSKINAGVKAGEISAPNDVLGAHVASLVDLRWTLGPNDTPGRATFPSIVFPPQSHHLLTMAPIHWDIKLNNETVECGSENTGLAGSVQNLRVGVRNTSGSSLPPIAVHINAYQDHQNGGQNYRLETKMAVTGNSKFLVPMSYHDESHYHDCGFIFFTAGVYKLEVSGSPTNTNTPLLSKNCMSSSVFSTEQLTTSNSSAKIDSSYHLWKLSPPIEISIIDP